MQSKSCPIPLFSKTDRVLVNEVNTLDDSFSTLDFREELPKFWSLLTNVNLDRKMVEKLLLGVKQRVIPGPDGIGGRVLENYAPRFFFCVVFILSLYHRKVPCLWKDAIISPVLKTRLHSH